MNSLEIPQYVCSFQHPFRKTKTNLRFNVEGFNEGIGFTSDRKAKKTSSLHEPTQRVATQEATVVIRRIKRDEAPSG